jgi:protein-S-isoprenylcysteine O-methyltransferase Ste14
MKSASGKVIIAGLLGLAAFIGLPLLSCGIRDLGGFFQNPARLLYCVGLLIQLVAMLMLPQAGMSRGEGEKTVEWQRIAVRIMLALSLAIMAVGPYCDRRGIASLPKTDLCRYAGLALLVIGFFAMIWATKYLAEQFSVQVTIQKNHRLVTDGPYRFLRHPRYFGVLLFLAGFSLVFLSWLALLLVAAMALVLGWRIYNEEILMREEFHADWESYSRRTGCLIPFVY